MCLRLFLISRSRTFGKLKPEESVCLIYAAVSLAAALLVHEVLSCGGQTGLPIRSIVYMHDEMRLSIDESGFSLNGGASFTWHPATLAGTGTHFLLGTPCLRGLSTRFDLDLICKPFFFFFGQSNQRGLTHGQRDRLTFLDIHYIIYICNYVWLSTMCRRGGVKQC